LNIKECVDYLNFWISKEKGAYYTIDELTQLIDRAQMAFYSDIKPRYAESQLIKDTLAPFRTTYDFNTANTISGVVVVPSNSNYLDLLDIQVYYTFEGRTIYFPIMLVNEDERADRLMSQVEPVTQYKPIGEQLSPRYFRIYPTQGWNGTVTYFRRPVKPVYGYSVISGRVIVYDPNTSVQLEWRETEINKILLKALSSIGINLSAADVSQFSELKTQSNYQGLNQL
jgi:hypothetical protein